MQTHEPVPEEAHLVMIFDPDAMLPIPVALERFELVPNTGKIRNNVAASRWASFRFAIRAPPGTCG
jgi:hypothetical protein